MTANAFIDTNIYIYALTNPKNEADGYKRDIALSVLGTLAASQAIITSIQVLNEFHSVLIKKGSIWVSGSSINERPQIWRHSGMDCRNPVHMDVNVNNATKSIATRVIKVNNLMIFNHIKLKKCHPWHLDSGNPCRNDSVFCVLKKDLKTHKEPQKIQTRGCRCF